MLLYYLTFACIDIHSINVNKSSYPKKNFIKTYETDKNHTSLSCHCHVHTLSIIIISKDDDIHTYMKRKMNI